VSLVLLDHYFGSLHNGCDSVALLELQFFGATAGNHALDPVGPHTNNNQRHYIVDMISSIWPFSLFLAESVIPLL